MVRPQKVVTTQLYFADEFLAQLYKEVDPYRTHRQMTVPELKGRMVDRIRNDDDPVFEMDMSKPLTQVGTALSADWMRPARDGNCKRSASRQSMTKAAAASRMLIGVRSATASPSPN